MNITEIMERHDWDAERKRRLKYVRKQKIKDALREARLEIAIMVAILIGFIAFLIWWNVTEPTRGRTAYLEGRYGFDHATAVAMAEEEVR